MVITPAGFERYFARMRAEREGVEPPDWALQPIPEIIWELSLGIYPLVWGSKQPPILQRFREDEAAGRLAA